jgi:hypothetical protein
MTGITSNAANMDGCASSFLNCMLQILYKRNNYCNLLVSSPLMSARPAAQALGDC